MKCLECGTEIEKGISKCPNCGKTINDDLDFELPVLKTEVKEKELSNTVELNPDLEKTRSIFEMDKTKDLNLLDDINKVIEENNEEALEKEEDETTPEVEEKEEDTSLEEKSSEEEEAEEEGSVISLKKIKVNENDDKETVKKDDELVETPSSDVFVTTESVKKRTHVLVIMSICFCIVILGMLVSLYFVREKEPSKSTSYIVNLEDALNEYFNKDNIDNIVFVLEDVKKDDNKVKDVQRITRITCDSWMVMYVNENPDTVEDYERITDKYRGMINGLHDDAVVKYNDEYVRALGDNDYEELIKQVNNIYSDGSGFYDAISMYNNKDYNKAYYLFSKVNPENSYYERAQKFLDTIVDNVLDILKTDIRKIEIGIDDLSEDEKLSRYIQIEEIIIAYKNTYMTLELDKNSKYLEILNEYRNKVGSLGNDQGVLANSGL